MTSLLESHTECMRWVEAEREALIGSSAYGKIESAVVWTEKGALSAGLLGEVDPKEIVDEINEEGMPLLYGHDPGRPVGRFLAAKFFKNSDGEAFIVAMAGFFTVETQVTFVQLGLDTSVVPQPVRELPPLQSDVRIIVGVDPREVDAAWLDGAIENAPVTVVRKELSHNTAEVLQELLRVGLPYVVLVWNPFVTAIAKEAGRDTYVALREWTKRFLKHVSMRRNPILEIQSVQRDCLVSFLLRGNDLHRLYRAYEMLPMAATQAAILIDSLRARRTAARSLTYEFDAETGRWFPSYAELFDGRMVSDRRLLVAAEQLPRSLSLGLSRNKE